MQRMLGVGALLLIVVSGAGGVFPARLHGQAKYVIWDGAYTAAQAEKGKVAYGTHCVTCHGSDDRGGRAPALSGELFWTHWETKTVDELFHKVRDTMPRSGGGFESSPVSEKDKLDIVAHVLQRNGFPAGSRELTADPLLATLEIIPQGGPSPPRNGSMAQAIGCLENREGRWLLTNSTEPQKTKLEKASDDDLRAAASAALGTGTVELISVFPSPKPHIGRRLRAKGLLVILPAGNKINVMSLEVIAQACTP